MKLNAFERELLEGIQKGAINWLTGWNHHEAYSLERQGIIEIVREYGLNNGELGCYRLVEVIDYAADSGDFDTASRITPDPAGDDVTADDGRPVDVLRTAHTYRAVMARLYGTYSAKAQRAAAVFESLFAVRNVRFA